MNNISKPMYFGKFYFLYEDEKPCCVRWKEVTSDGHYTEDDLKSNVFLNNEKPEHDTANAKFKLNPNALVKKINNDKRKNKPKIIKIDKFECDSDHRMLNAYDDTEDNSERVHLKRNNLDQNSEFDDVIIGQEKLTDNSAEKKKELCELYAKKIQKIINDNSDYFKSIDINTPIKIYTDLNEAKENNGIYLSTEDGKLKVILYTKMTSKSARKILLANILGDLFKNVKGTEITKNTITIGVKPSKQGTSTSIFATDFMNEDVIESAIKKYNKETGKNLSVSDFIKKDEEGGKIYRFGKNNVGLLKDIILTSISKSNKFSAQEKKYMEKLLNSDIDENFKKNTISNELFISFGEIFIPYLLLSRNEENKDVIKNIIDMFPNAPDAKVLGVEYPISQNNGFYDYKLITSDGVNANVIQNDETLDQYMKDNAEFIRFLEVSAKYDQGHKVSITTEIKNNYEKYLNSLPEEAKENFEKDYGDTIIAKLHKSLNKKGNTKYIAIIEAVTSNIPGLDKNFLDLCKKFAKNRNDPDIINEFNEKYKEKFFNYVVEQTGKPISTEVVNNFPNSITYLCCDIINSKLNKKDKDGRCLDQECLKRIMSATPYYQVRIEAGKELHCQVTQLDKDLNFYLMFGIASASSDFTLGKGNIGVAMYNKEEIDSKKSKKK